MLCDDVFCMHISFAYFLSTATLGLELHFLLPKHIRYFVQMFTPIYYFPHKY